jgi:hypothetical protein
MILLAALAFAAPKNCPNQAQIDALHARIAALEAELAAVKAAAGTPTEAEEMAASALMATVTEAVAAANYPAANDALGTILREYPNTRAGKAAARMQPEIGLVGTGAVPLAVEFWYQGRADYVDAPVTLVVFFEEWCPHCRNSMPELAGRVDELKKRGVQIVALTKVTKSSTDDKVRTFLTENAIPFPVAKEDGAMSKAFVVTGIPAAAMVRDGVVIWRGHPSRLDAKLLDSLVK